LAFSVKKNINADENIFASFEFGFFQVLLKFNFKIRPLEFVQCQKNVCLISDSFALQNIKTYINFKLNHLAYSLLLTW